MHGRKFPLTSAPASHARDLTVWRLAVRREGDSWRVVSCGGKVYRKVFDNGEIRVTELLPTPTLQPLSDLLATPDLLSL